MDYWNEVKSSLRMVGKSPVFTVAAMAAPAFGIAGSPAVEA